MLSVFFHTQLESPLIGNHTVIYGSHCDNIMKSRLEDLPTFETRQVMVKAVHYNLVQVALKRLGSPQRFSLPRLRTLDLHLEKDAWIVVDKSLSDIPVMAWLDFDVAGREDLYNDVACTLKIYHSHAGMLIKKVMEAMTLLIGERLAPLSNGPATVSPLPKRL